MVWHLMFLCKDIFGTKYIHKYNDRSSTKHQPEQEIILSGTYIKGICSQTKCKRLNLIKLLFYCPPALPN